MTNNAQTMLNKQHDDIEYWEERSGQIAWRLFDTRKTVARMEKDYRECVENIKRIKGLNATTKGGDDGR